MNTKKTQASNLRFKLLRIRDQQHLKNRDTHTSHTAWVRVTDPPTESIETKSNIL